jgi:hypothetical protein
VGAPTFPVHVGAQAVRFAEMIDDGHLATVDPLGIGGLLIDALRIEQLLRQRAVSGDGLLLAILAAARDGLGAYERTGELRLPAADRLAFRELGLSIGLHGVSAMRRTIEDEPERFSSGPELRSALDSFAAYVPLGSEIEAFWLEPSHQETSTWTEHRNINEVMLATSLVPEGFLGPIRD